jgi:hypothetical protein
MQPMLAAWILKTTELGQWSTLEGPGVAGTVPVRGLSGNLVTRCGCSEICVEACCDHTAPRQPPSHGIGRGER